VEHLVRFDSKTDTVRHAWIRAAGFRDEDEARCECARSAHEHQGGRCPAVLKWSRRGHFSDGGWEATGTESYVECLILCADCYAVTTMRRTG
jgi:hypothetical protein